MAADQTLPLEFRARAFYLAGNLDFLRGEYRSAVSAYDAALKLVPGLPEDAGVDGIGRDAAYNRAIALRRIEDEERDAGNDASPPDSGEPDGGEQPDAGQDSGQPDAGEDGGEQNQPDSGKPDQPDAGQDGGEQDQPKNDQQDGGNDQQQQDQQQPQQKPEPKPQPQPQPQNQDDRLLDQLEQTPTLQQHLNKLGRRRIPAAEDK